MNSQLMIAAILLGSCVAGAQIPGVATAQEDTAQDITTRNTPTLEQVRVAGALRSSYRKPISQAKSSETPQANLEAFRAEIEPTLKKACYECHGSETAEGEFRVDTLDPDLLHGEDVDRWLKVSAAVGNSEMPPEDGPQLADDDRSKIIAWLSSEIQVASQVRRTAPGNSSFRRMTRYEYNYGLQDLLGLELEFANDLPPDPVSEDGFRNSSEMLQMSAKQYADYLEINRNALNRATVRGERPEMLYWGISAERAATRRTKTRQELDAEIEQNAKKNTEEEIEKNVEVEVQATETPAGRRGGRGGGRGRGGRGAHYKNTKTGKTSPATWEFRRAVHAWAPTMTLPEVPEQSDYVAVLPAGQGLIVELGNRLSAVRRHVKGSDATRANRVF
jgi:mono/diheme cytochrome c family protein